MIRREPPIPIDYTTKAQKKEQAECVKKELYAILQLEPSKGKDKRLGGILNILQAEIPNLRESSFSLTRAQLFPFACRLLAVLCIAHNSKREYDRDDFIHSLARAFLLQEVEETDDQCLAEAQKLVGYATHAGLFRTYRSKISLIERGQEQLTDELRAQYGKPPKKKGETQVQISARKAWPWQERKQALTCVAEHLAELLEKSSRTIKEWANQSSWYLPGENSNDGRIKIVDKERCIASLLKKGVLK